MKKKNKIDLNIQPNTSLANKTGSWRTQKPITDYNICIGCSLCAKICPEACIIMAKQENGKLKPRTDYDYCKGCALCAKECPVKAIKMVKDY
jgi:pyruvate ferredoxin oxidoreductase delta subunit